MASRVTTSKPALKLKDIAFALGAPRRWKILTELGKGEPLPVTEIAKRTGFSLNAASKVLCKLRDGGILERGYGKLYRIPAHLLSQSEGVIDFGPAVVRLDTSAPETK